MFSQTSDNINNNSIINNLTEIILEIIGKVKNNPNIEREFNKYNYKEYIRQI